MRCTIGSPWNPIDLNDVHNDHHQHQSPPHLGLTLTTLITIALPTFASQALLSSKNSQLSSNPGPSCPSGVLCFCLCTWMPYPKSVTHRAIILLVFTVRFAVGWLQPLDLQFPSRRKLVEGHSVNSVFLLSIPFSLWNFLPFSSLSRGQALAQGRPWFTHFTRCTTSAALGSTGCVRVGPSYICEISIGGLLEAYWGPISLLQALVVGRWVSMSIIQCSPWSAITNVQLLRTILNHH